MILTILTLLSFAESWAEERISFNRDIRSILSNNCFQCHGPDKKQRQGGTDGLRLDTAEGALADLGGYAAIVRGKPNESSLIHRVTTSDADERMPPVETGKELTSREIELLTDWISQGAPYARHWSYVKPVRPQLPKNTTKSWSKNEIDYFISARHIREKLEPSAEANRYTLIRRVSLDLTGLPPSLDEVERFVHDKDPKAYENLVDRLLKKETYGEHWARMWLDLARYADSAGYADDPPRTIWAYRDYVIRAINANTPFNQFTIEQIAGDLLPTPSNDQLIATAFHRNTLTNSEGGTNDEEFRNVAIVDRVNTTMATWMGTTIACAQCHDHKYDPISQEEFFRLFAVFNNTEDSDKRNESPLLDIYTDEQKKQTAARKVELASLEKKLATSTPELAAQQAQWEKRFSADPKWNILMPESAQAKSGAEMTIIEDGSVRVATGAKTDVYTLKSTIEEGMPITAIRIETLPDDSLPKKGPGHGGGNFSVSRVLATIKPTQGTRPSGQIIRIEIPGKQKILSLAEVQVFSGSENVAIKGEAKQSSTGFSGPANLAIDGNTNGDYNAAKSTTHTAISDNPWWEVDVRAMKSIDRVVVWNRTDNGLHTRLANFKITVFNDKRQPIFEKMVKQSPNPSATYALSGVREVKFGAAFADFTQSGFDVANVIKSNGDVNKGWSVGPEFGKPHSLTLIPTTPIEASAGSQLSLVIEQLSRFEKHTLGHLRVGITSDSKAAEYSKTPADILAILKNSSATQQQKKKLAAYYRTIAPLLKPARDRLATLKKQLAAQKPATTVPIMRELPKGKQRKTNIQRRGNFLDVGKEVTVGVPSAFHPLRGDEQLNRLTLARWLVDENNPLTARVIVNRYWEAIFGVGIVRTSEEFGTQGELPMHPELLDWLATELVEKHWDIKHLLKLLVTSATYRQSSLVTPELLEQDPDNRLLARGPRFRLSAEMIRDQALFVSGLLSSKMYGAPVKPLQPKLGVNAAFGSGIDWQPSEGEDRHRRGLYTMWRRSNPYPSMATFDAPNREVCTVRRDRTNTPLQALVTLNDPVYFEAAQALGRRMLAMGETATDRVKSGFQLCLSRPPGDEELARLVALYKRVHHRLSENGEKATHIATKPIGPAPSGANMAELASLTIVGNVLLNLDEMFLKR